MRIKFAIGICLASMLLLFNFCLTPSDGGDSGDGGAIDTLEWEQITTTSIWQARSGHQAVVFDCKIWVIGGYDGTNRLNDVWYSEDGTNWFQAKIESSIWQGRAEHLSLVFNDGDGEKMWVIGGSSGNERLNDIWYSSDGVTWVKKETFNPMWEARTGHTGAVFNEKMWVIDGYNLTIYKNDIWSSANGNRWIKEVDSNKWCDRIMDSCVVYDNKLWVLGGFGIITNDLFNDVWYSIDGQNWIRAISITTKWSPRYSMPVIVFEGKMWVLGGAVADNQRSNEIWKSL